MIPSPELQAKVAVWRARAADGSITEAEMKEAIAVMRQGRMSASTAAAKARAKTAVPSADDLLAGMDDL